MKINSPMHYIVIILLAISSCSSPKDENIQPNEPITRIINFSGYEWIVRTSDDAKQGPGPNLFSDSEDNVWVDNEGRLHLKIVQKGGHWYCAGVTLRLSQGYKKYVFYVASRVDQLDENVVGGLFTYKNDNEEIDNFYTDPPNAVLTWVDGGEVKEVEVVITDAIFDGNTISYTIINNTGIITGDIVYVSLFIDDPGADSLSAGNQWG